ncbi:recombinase zinc beta ribbon domain-containing protein [Rhizobium beringeri]
MRVLNDRDLPLRRDRFCELRWARATVSAVARILKNPPTPVPSFMDGPAFCAAGRDGGSEAKTPKDSKDWRIIVKDRYPHYIDWSTYEKIRDIVRDNRAGPCVPKPGAPRDGELSLHRIAWCGRCGYKMYVRYKGGGEYACNHLHSHSGLPDCQRVRAAQIDAAVADAFLAALAPGELDALARARQAQQRVNKALRAGAERELDSSATPRRWQNASSIALTLIIVWSPPNSSVDGKQR